MSHTLLDRFGRQNMVLESPRIGFTFGLPSANGSVVGKSHDLSELLCFQMEERPQGGGVYVVRPGKVPRHRWHTLG